MSTTATEHSSLLKMYAVHQANLLLLHETTERFHATAE